MATPTHSTSAPVRLIVTAAVVLSAMAAISLYELVSFDWHPAREEPASFTAYHFVRMAISAILAAGLILALAKPWLAAPSEPAPLEPAELRNASVVTAFAAAAIVILALSPDLFHWFAREDNILEWLSALFILAGSVFFLIPVTKTLRRRVGGVAAIIRRLLIPIGFAGLFFLIAMEEISWGQRIIGFETPENLAERNWQQEFNFHNIHTDLFELLYYFATGAFLVLLPLAGPVLRDWKPFALFADFIPNRSVAILSAPMVIFSYGHWNLIPLQFITFAALFAMIVLAMTARRAGRRGEARLCGVLAVVIAIGQLAMLYFGPAMLDVPDATEFRELFLSIGLFAFAAYYAFDVAPVADPQNNA